MVAALAAPATTAVASPPAVDQYTQHLPGAGGGSGLASGSAPVAQPWLLPAKTRAALAGPDGQLLALIATAPGLGAPRANPGVEAGATAGEERSFVTAAVSTVAAAPSLALVGALVAIGAAAWAMRRRSST